MIKYNDGDYSVRNMLVSILESFIKNSNMDRKVDLYFFEELVEDGFEDLAPFIKNEIIKLIKLEKKDGKEEMAFMHMSKEELQNILNSLLKVKMNPNSPKN